MHTKGKWEAYFGHDNQFAGEPLISAPRDNGLPHAIVARLVDGTIPELAANARLIAAAPDMYEALKALKEWDIHRSTFEIPDGLIVQLSTAICKAEGK